MTAEAALAHLARTPHLLVALDFDGTVSLLSDDPMSVRMAPSSAAAVAALAAAPETTVAFVSGRSLDDLRVIAEHTDDAPYLLAGSHGAEFWFPDGRAAGLPAHPADEALRDDLRAVAERLIAGVPGAWVEPKALGFGIHTRLADAAGAAHAQREVDALMAARAAHWRRRVGRDIVEYSFRDEGKDTAVAALREATGATAVLFAGDDVTDEDALAALGDADLGIRVGDGPTAADLRVSGIGELAELLARLAHERVAARE